jgi:hypothetical protein
MKPKTLLLLALVVGALAAAVLLFEKELPSTDERTARAKRVMPVEADELVALELEWQGKRARFERDAKPDAKAEKQDADATPPERRWRMLEPFATAADTPAVDGLVRRLAALEVDRELEGAARADVGLEPPRGKVAWRTATRDGVVEIGGEVPASSTVVVAATGRKDPAVVSDAVVSDLEKEPGEWRSREVLGAQRSDIERVTLRPAGAPEVVLAKSGETLRLEAPVGDVADREAVDQLLGDLTALRVETFLDAPLTGNTTAALAAAAATIEVQAKGSDAPLVVELGGGEPVPGKRIVRAADQAFVATTRLLDSATRPADAWRSRHWTRFENWRIERVAIDDAQGKLVLERKDGNWLRDGVEVPFAAASDLLYALTAAKAGTVGATAPTSKPLFTLALSDADGNEETLTLHPAEGDVVPARVSGRDLTLLLPKSAADDVTSKVGALRAVQPVTPPAPVPASEGEKKEN